MDTGQVFLTRYKPPTTTAPALMSATDLVQPPIATSEQAQWIDRQQSLEVIHTLLAASIGSMAYLRGLFPDDCFVKMRYGVNRSATNYRIFSMESDEKTDDRHIERGGTKITRLARGKSREADRLLDWLENGVFQALADGQLMALQIAIYLEESQPDVVSESYTFSFSYLHGNNIPELEITDIHGYKVTINDASKGAQQMTRRLLTITENLPPLPDHRWLTIRLHYHDSTPADYNPPGFTRLPLGSAGLVIPGNGEQIQRQHCGTMNTGFHSVSLQVSCAAPISSRPSRIRRSISRFSFVDNDIEIPRFDFKRSTTAGSVVSLADTPSMLLHNPEPAPDLRDASWADKSIIEMDSELPVTLQEKQEQPLSASGPAHKDVVEKATLNRMLAPIRTKTDWLLTQPADHTMASHQEGLISTTVTGKRLSDDITSLPISKRVRSNEQTRANKMVLKKSSAVKLLAGCGRDNETRKKNRRLQVHKITCECAYPEEDGDMICCDLCGGWQHAHCYGFTSALDERLADLHCCYTCLLQEENVLLAAMKELALFRRALRLIWDNHKVPSTCEAFASEIGCNTASATAVIGKLELEGFVRIRGRDGGRAQWKSHPKNLGLEVVRTDQTRGLEAIYFNPSLNVEHHVRISSMPSVYDAKKSLMLQKYIFRSTPKRGVDVYHPQPFRREPRGQSRDDVSPTDKATRIDNEELDEDQYLRALPAKDILRLGKKDSSVQRDSHSPQYLSSIGQCETAIWVGNPA